MPAPVRVIATCKSVRMELIEGQTSAQFSLVKFRLRERKQGKPVGSSVRHCVSRQRIEELLGGRAPGQDAIVNFCNFNSFSVAKFY